MPGRDSSSPSRSRWARGLVYLALLVVSALVLARYAKPSTPELADLMPAEMLADTESGRAGDLLLVAIVGASSRPDDARLAEVERAVAAVEGVTRVASAPSLDADAPAHLRDFLSGEGARTLIALVDASARSEKGAASFAERLEAGLSPLRRDGDEIVAFADPLMRAAYQRQTARDLGWGVAVIFLPVVLFAMVLFGSPSAAVMALVLGMVTSALAALGQHLVDGRLSPAAAFLLPFAFSVATLDAFHLARRHQVLHHQGHPDAARAAIAQLFAPCLITTATTAVGLSVLAWTSSVPLLRDTGKWAAVATVLAYVLTFAVGARLLPAEPPPPRGIGPTVTRCLRRLVVGALRHPRRTVALWGLLFAASLPLVAQLESRPTYPDPFVEGHPWSMALARLERALDVSTDVVQLDVTSDLKGRGGEIRAVNGTLALQVHLEGDPAVALALGAGTFLRRAKTLDELHRLAEERGGATGISRALVAEDRRTLTTLVILRREADRAAFRARLDGWLEGRRGRNRLGFAGPRETRRRIQALSLDHVTRSLPLSVLAIALVLLMLRGVKLALVALVTSAIPVAVAAAALFLIGSGWNLAMLAGATVLLAVAVDDSIHLLWPLRARSEGGPSTLTRVVPMVGPALLATTVVLAGAFLALASSQIQFNRDQGAIAALGLVVALVADLTLLPALMRSRR